MKEIRVVDETRLAGYVFRVAEFEAGACSRSIACRLELTDRGGYSITFYGPHAFGLQDAQAKRNPMVAIPLDLADLVQRAIQHAARLNDEFFKFTQSGGLAIER